MTDPQEPEAAQRGAERAQRTAEAWAEHIVGQEEPTYIGQSARGPVVLESVQVVTEQGITWLDARTRGETETQDPHFRIVNPPLLVEDPTGPIVINGRTFREDPLAALAQAIGEHGGAMQARRRGQ